MTSGIPHLSDSRRPMTFECRPSPPIIDRVVNLLKKPNAFCYIGPEGTKAYKAFSELKSYVGATGNFVHATSVEVAKQKCEEAGFDPVILLPTRHGKSFNLYALTAFNATYFAHMDLLWANWVVTISENSADRRTTQCAMSLRKWFREWVTYTMKPRVVTSKATRRGENLKQIQLPWGLSVAGDNFVTTRT